MAILNIVKELDPILRKTSKVVEEISPKIITLLDDMIETLHNADGCGLAAPQVGVLKRIAIVEVEEGKIYELINPKIIAFSGKQTELEGCLSIPGKWGYTNRPKSVTVEALNRKGEKYRITGQDLLARALCHEIDHLDGHLFTDKAVKMLSAKEMEELER